MCAYGKPLLNLNSVHICSYVSQYMSIKKVMKKFFEFQIEEMTDDIWPVICRLVWKQVV